MKTLLGLVAASALALSAGAALAQDYNQNPTYGSVQLTSGFTPDPYQVNLQSGGSINAATALGQQNSACVGNIASAPDYRLNYTNGRYPLIISVASSADTTLVINGPDGRWYCDDDGGVNGLNPMVRFNTPASGQYDIWVGTYGGNNLNPATLNISEVTSQ